MRILVTSAYTPDGETGSAQVAKRLSHKLSEKHQVMYLCLGKKLKVHKIKRNLSYLTIPSVNINDIWIPTLDSQVVNEISAKLDVFGPDVVHAHNIIFGGLIALIWAHERNVPYVLTFHSIPSEGIGYVFPKLQDGKIISTLNYHLAANYIKNFVKHVDLIIALNQPIVDSLAKLEIKTPYKVINNGLDLKKFYKLKTTVPTDKIKFIYPGSYTERKNQEYLLEVFAHLPKSYILNLFGNKTSGSSYVERLQKLIDNKKIQNVFVHDFLDSEKLIKEYEKTHYLVSASLKEVQSLVYVESLAAGKPVIALENEAVDEIINPSNGLPMSKETTPKEFAEKLLKFVKQTNKKYISASEISRASVSQFDMNLVINNLISAYKYAKAIKSSKPIITETAFYSLIKDIVPNPIDGIIPHTFKAQKSLSINPLRRSLFLTWLIGVIAYLITIFLRIKR